MVDYAFGGNDEENAELKTIKAEVVKTTSTQKFFGLLIDLPNSSQIPITLRPGRS